MGVWRIGVDELARSRFAMSAFTETVAALAVLAGVHRNPGLHDWARAHRPAYREMVDSDPFAAAFVAAVYRPRWISDLVTVPPRPGDRTFYDELRRIRETPATLAHRQLAKDGRLPRALRVPDVAERSAKLLEWVWTQTVRADWPRRRRVFEADIVSRTQRLAAEGWAGALDHMRPGMRWLGDGRLQINTYDYPPRDLSDADLAFVPCTSGRGWVAWDQRRRYAIMYPCTGMLADAAGPAPPGALERLIGPARAGILVQLGEPRSTSQLVASTGYVLGSVGRHLKVLLDAELVQRRRAGRSVLYYRTRLGDQLANRSGPRRH
jgi:DNA-binding transcriptional ArsR family regulator